MKKTISFSILFLSAIALSATAVLTNAEEVQALVVDNGDNNSFTLCHKGKLTLVLPIKAAAAHLRHGDDFGACLPTP